MHLVLRGLPRMPSFRSQVLYEAFERAFRRTRRPDFRIVEYSVQSNHLHLIVEADDNGALERGMKSFAVRANRLFNAAWGRKRGRVWADRYFRRDLDSARQVRAALVYCLANFKKHRRAGFAHAFLDACSSARWFEGWYFARPPDPQPRPTEHAKTELLAEAWLWLGRLMPTEAPVGSA